MRVLFASTAPTGHFRPLLPFAEACRRAGHEILFAGQGEAAQAAERAGFAAQPVAEADPEAVSRFQEGQAGLPPQQAMLRALADLYVGLRGGAGLGDLVATVEAWRPDVVVRESAEFASLIAAEHLGVPHVLVGIGLSADLETQMLAGAGPALDELGATIGVEPGLGARAAAVPRLTMAPPSFETSDDARSEQIRRFRADDSHTTATAPDGWGDPDAPLVYLSFGTEVPSRSREYFPAIYTDAVAALDDVGARVLVTIGNERDPGDLGPLPDWVRVERWASQADLMPHTAAMISHGGSGSTLMALAAGVPMAVVPLFADQPFNAGRVAATGAGVAIENGDQSLEALGPAVHGLLNEASYRERAGAIADEIGALPPVDEAAAVLEALALA